MDTNTQFKYKWWTRGDWGGFFGLFTNVVTNLMTLTSLLLFGVQMPAEIVMGRILPAIGVGCIVGNIYYGFAAKRLAKKENRHDVTALPYGVSVPHMFTVTFVVIGPVYWSTGDPILAWRTGLAWCVIEASIEILGSFAGPWIRRHVPRGAMLVTLAGLAITTIAMNPAFQIWEMPYISFISLAIVLYAFLGNGKMPFNLPAGLVMIIIGTIVGWVIGYMKPDELVTTIQSVNVSLPSFYFQDIFAGFQHIGPYVAVALPLGVTNAISTMDSVESAAAAGDNFNVFECMLVDGIGSMCGALMGSCYPTAVYIGHPGWKKMGARGGYSIATGLGSFLLCTLGIVPVLLKIIPLVAILPVLLYIGAIMAAQAFQEVPKRQAPAIALGLVPFLASWCLSLVDNALKAAGTTAAELGVGVLSGASVNYVGLSTLNGGAILTGMLLTCVAISSIERKLFSAAIYCGVASLCSYIGLMHAAKISIGANIPCTVGYLLMAVVFLIAWYFDERKNPSADNRLPVAEKGENE